MGGRHSKLSGDSVNSIDTSESGKKSRKTGWKMDADRPAHQPIRDWKDSRPSPSHGLTSGGNIVDGTGVQSEENKKDRSHRSSKSIERHGDAYDLGNVPTTLNGAAFDGEQEHRPESQPIYSISAPAPPDYTRVPRYTTTSEDRARPEPVTGKKPGWYQRYTNKRLGPGEPRDPVTGRGLYTGLTKEEVIERVQQSAPGLFGHGQAWPMSKRNRNGQGMVVLPSAGGLGGASGVW